MVQYPTIIIGMLTLGLVGYPTSAAVRLAGERLVVWRARELVHGAAMRRAPSPGGPRGPRALPPRRRPPRGRRAARSASATRSRPTADGAPRSRRRRLLVRHRRRRGLRRRRPVRLREDHAAQRHRRLPSLDGGSIHLDGSSCCAARAGRRPTSAPIASSCSRTAPCSPGRPTSRTSPSAPSCRGRAAATLRARQGAPPARGRRARRVRGRLPGADLLGRAAPRRDRARAHERSGGPAARRAVPRARRAHQVRSCTRRCSRAYAAQPRSRSSSSPTISKRRSSSAAGWSS